ncbi:MAG TPA: hypothetical protein VKW77_06990 [Acidimicrobiales bacterium]|nr:hypothetical protein [Acidimicrobiales bacterium]
MSALSIDAPAAAPGSRPAVEVTGGADPAVVAAVVAAVEAVWPRPRPVAPEPEGIPAWRFSGRWWSRPATVRRDRPWT